MVARIHASTNPRILSVLSFIHSYKRANNIAPSLLEIARHGKTSTSVASLWMDKAVDEGLLVIPTPPGATRRPARAWQLTESGEELLDTLKAENLAGKNG